MSSFGAEFDDIYDSDIYDSDELQDIYDSDQDYDSDYSDEEEVTVQRERKPSKLELDEIRNILAAASASAGQGRDSPSPPPPPPAHPPPPPNSPPMAPPSYPPPRVETVSPPPKPPLPAPTLERAVDSDVSSSQDTKPAKRRQKGRVSTLAAMDINEIETLQREAEVEAGCTGSNSSSSSSNRNSNSAGGGDTCGVGDEPSRPTKVKSTKLDVVTRIHKAQIDRKLEFHEKVRMRELRVVREEQKLRQQLETFYTKRAPEKVENIPGLLNKVYNNVNNVISVTQLNQLFLDEYGEGFLPLVDPVVQKARRTKDKDQRSRDRLLPKISKGEYQNDHHFHLALLYCNSLDAFPFDAPLPGKELLDSVASKEDLEHTYFPHYAKQGCIIRAERNVNLGLRQLLATRRFVILRKYLAHFEALGVVAAAELAVLQHAHLREMGMRRVATRKFHELVRVPHLHRVVVAEWEERQIRVGSGTAPEKMPNRKLKRKGKRKGDGEAADAKEEEGKTPAERLTVKQYDDSGLCDGGFPVFVAVPVLVWEVPVAKKAEEPDKKPKTCRPDRTEGVIFLEPPIPWEELDFSSFGSVLDQLGILQKRDEILYICLRNGWWYEFEERQSSKKDSKTDKGATKVGDEDKKLGAYLASRWTNLRLCNAQATTELNKSAVYKRLDAYMTEVQKLKLVAAMQTKCRMAEEQAEQTAK